MVGIGASQTKTKEELVEFAEEAHRDARDFVACMASDDAAEFLEKIVGLRFESMSPLETRAAMTLSRAEAIRIASEIS